MEFMSLFSFSDCFFLPIIIFIGLITSYQDFKYGKIKNKWVLSGLVWGLAVYAFFAVLALFGSPTTFFYYAPRIFINSIIALGVGYLFWRLDLWSAGDAKLFFIFSFLLPIEHYQRSNLPYFPSFALLVNIFLFVASYLAARNLFFAVRNLLKNKNFFSRLARNIKSEYPVFLKFILGFFLVFIFFQIIRAEVGSWLGQQDSGWNILFLAIFLSGFNLFKGFFQKGKNWLLAVLFLAIALYLCFGGFFSIQAKGTIILSAIRSSLVFTVIFALISVLLSYEEEEKQAYMPFAAWIFLGLLATIIAQGSLLNFIF